MRVQRGATLMHGMRDMSCVDDDDDDDDDDDSGESGMCAVAVVVLPRFIELHYLDWSVQNIKHGQFH